MLAGLLHTRAATTHLGNHKILRKSFVAHWPGFETTYHDTTNIMIFKKLFPKEVVSHVINSCYILQYLQLEATDWTKNLRYQEWFCRD